MLHINTVEYGDFVSETVQVRVSRRAHKKLLELRKTDMGTVRLYEVIDKLVDDYEKRNEKRS